MSSALLQQRGTFQLSFAFGEFLTKGSLATRQINLAGMFNLRLLGAYLTSAGHVGNINDHWAYDIATVFKIDSPDFVNALVPSCPGFILHLTRQPTVAGDQTGIPATNKFDTVIGDPTQVFVACQINNKLTFRITPIVPNGFAPTTVQTTGLPESPYSFAETFDEDGIITLSFEYQRV
jgi:hypothetical protein